LASKFSFLLTVHALYAATRAALRLGRTGLVAGVVPALIGCTHRGTEPSTQPANVFPPFALIDVNPYSASAGRTLTRAALAGPAAVVFFGWST
jgi:hypothetical protein